MLQRNNHLHRLRYGKYILLLLVLLPPVLFYAGFFYYSVNMPVGDDYHVMLRFLDGFTETTSLREKAKMIVMAHVEHRIVLDRVLTVLNYRLFGSLHFTWLAFIGCLSLVGIFLVLARRLRQITTDVFYLFPIAVVLFSFAHWDNMTCTMCAMSNLTVHLFVLLSLYFLTGKEPLSTRSKALSIVFMVAAAFTQGGGLFLIPVALLILLWRSDYRFAAVFLLCSLAVLALYFYGYTPPQRAGFWMLAQDLKGRLVLFVFSFIGNAFNFYKIYSNNTLESVLMSGLAGFSMLLVCAHIIRTRYYEKNMFVAGILLFIIIVSVVAAVTRCHLGLTTAGDSRYRINGAMFVCALILWMADTGMLSATRHKLIALALTVCFWLFMNLNQHEFLHFRKRELMYHLMNYYTGDFEARKINPYTQYQFKLLVTCELKGIYRLPPFKNLEQYFPYSPARSFSRKAAAPQPMTISVDTVLKAADSYLISGWGFINGQPTKQQQIYVGLQAADSSVTYFAARQEPRFDLNSYFRKFNLKHGGFIARIKFTDIEKGSYRIVLRIENGGQTAVKESDKVLHY